MTQMANNCEAKTGIVYRKGECFKLGTGHVSGYKSFRYNCLPQNWNKHLDLQSEQMIDDGVDGRHTQWYIYVVGVMVVLLLFVCGLYGGCYLYKKGRKPIKEMDV